MSVALKTRLIGMYGHELAGVAHSMAKLGFKDNTLMDGIMKESFCLFRFMSAEQLSRLAWSFGELECAKPKLMAALEKQVQPIIHQCSSRQLYRLLFGFANLGMLRPFFFQEMADRAARPEDHSLDALTASGMTWSLATVGFPHHALFQKIVQAAPALLPDMDLAQLSKFTWALGTMQHRDEALLAQIPGRALELMASDGPDDRASQMISLVLGLSVLDVFPEELLQAFLKLLRDAPPQAVDQLEPQVCVQLHQVLCRLLAQGMSVPEPLLTVTRAQFSEDKPVVRKATFYDPAKEFRVVVKRVLQDMIEELEFEDDFDADFVEPTTAYRTEGVLRDRKMLVLVLDKECYQWNSPDLLGHVALKVKTLESMGWQVLALSYWEHQTLITEREQLVYIDSVLKPIYHDTVWAER